MSLPLLSLRGVSIRIAGRVLIDNLALTMHAGQRLAILGQNGTGKTTLLHTIAGLRPFAAGEIIVNQRRLGDWPRRSLAQQLGLLFQSLQDDMPSTVLETAMLGRLPHARHWQWESVDDIAAVDQALHAMHLADLAHRDISSLSGGERQRLAIASLLAQNPLIYLLDEPGNHLDISFQIKVLQLFRERTLVQPKTMVMATHDINLAASFCDQVLLLYGDGRYRLGDVATVLTDEILSDAYQCRISHVKSAGNRIFFVDMS